jgi:hypothetical protein
VSEMITAGSCESGMPTLLAVALRIEPTAVSG